MSISEHTVKVDRRYLDSKSKQDLVVLVMQLLDIGEKRDKQLAAAEAADNECLNSLWKMTDRCNEWRDRYIKLEHVVVEYIRSPEGCGQEEYKALEAAISKGDEHG